MDVQFGSKEKGNCSFRGMSLLKLCMCVAFVSTALARKGRALLAPRDRPWLNRSVQL